MDIPDLKNASTRASIRFSKPGVPLLKGQILLWQFEHALSSKTSKSGGAMAPLAPLLTQALQKYFSLNERGVNNLKIEKNAPNFTYF